MDNLDPETTRDCYHHRTHLRGGSPTVENLHLVQLLDLIVLDEVNPLIATLKPQSNGPSYTVIGTLAVDWWAVTFGTARRRLGGAAARAGPSSLYQM